MIGNGIGDGIDVRIGDANSNSPCTLAPLHPCTSYLCSLSLTRLGPSCRYAEGAGMLTKDEAEKIAAAANIYRPDWSVPQVMGVLAKNDIRIRRTYHDTAHAMLAIALDPATLQPTRLLEAGPWWNARPNRTPVAAVERVDWQTACATCLKPRDHLWHAGTGTVHDCEYLHPRDHAQAVTARRREKETA